MKKLLFLLFLSSFAFSAFAQKDRQKVERIIDPVESMPSYPGGWDSLAVYLKKNNRWQQGQVTVEGTVVVGFIVNQKGELSDIRLLKKIYPTCDTEAIRLVEYMPKWIPAEENGKPVAKRMVIPIRFGGL